MVQQRAGNAEIAADGLDPGVRTRRRSPAFPAFSDKAVQFLPKGLSRNNHSNRSVEKPASTSNPVRRIFATGRFFINFGGAPRHGHYPYGRGSEPDSEPRPESGPGKGVWLFPDDY
jgi:hypothetical protein